ncbi:MAG: hypothetical protein U0625_01415 [Phycisphaerales bacterium]
MSQTPPTPPTPPTNPSQTPTPAPADASATAAAPPAAGTPPAARPSPPARRATDPARLLEIATLRQFVGADEAVAVLEHAVELALRESRRLEHTLIAGPPDAGKQILARALARDALQRTVEVDATWIRSAHQLGRMLRRLAHRDLLVLHRADLLGTHARRVLVSLLGLRTLRRDPETTKQLADITLVATASDATTAALAPLARACPLRVIVPAPDFAARVAATARAAVALGMAPTPATRAAAEAQLSRALARGLPADPAILARRMASTPPER